MARRRPGRPRKLSRLDWHSQTLVIGDYVNYMEPYKKRARFTWGIIEGFNNGYLAVRCMEEGDALGKMHFKHPYQMIKFPTRINNALQEANAPKELTDAEWEAEAATAGRVSLTPYVRVANEDTPDTGPNEIEQE